MPAKATTTTTKVKIDYTGSIIDYVTKKINEYEAKSQFGDIVIETSTDLIKLFMNDAKLKDFIDTRAIKLYFSGRITGKVVLVRNTAIKDEAHNILAL